MDIIITMVLEEVCCDRNYLRKWSVMCFWNDCNQSLGSWTYQCWRISFNEI